MKVKDSFILREVAGQNVVLPMDGDIDMNTMITLNGTGAFLWERLQSDTSEDALVAALLAEYDVDEKRARESVQRFIRTLEENGFLE